VSGPHDAVAFLGLGRMGLPMSLNLARAGFAVRAWNRSSRAVEDAPENYRFMGTAKEAAEDAHVVITMLPDLHEVKAVCDGPAGAMASAATGAIVVVMGTVSPVAMRTWGDELTSRGFRVVDAPVSGGDVGAEEGTLSIMCGGGFPDFEVIKPVLAAMGSTIRYMGPLGAGQLTKACNQIVVAGTLAVLAEAVTLARQGGLDLAELLDALAGGLAGSRLLETKRQNLLTRSYLPGGSAAFQHKDLGFALDAGRAHGVALPVSSIVDQLFGAMRWTGHGDEDHSGVARIIELLSHDD
jgi:2-hydroxy-3-oxopropionate reductase